MRLLLRLVMLVAALWAALRLLLAVAGLPARRSRGGWPPAGPAPGPRGRMVRCRICDTYVAADRALTLSERGTTLYFCGEECRDAHRARAGGRA